MVSLGVLHRHLWYVALRRELLLSNESSVEAVGFIARAASVADSGHMKTFMLAYTTLMWVLQVDP
jgi:hypothetical protein